MKAVVIREFGPVEATKVEEVPAPAVGPHDVLVKVEAAPVNFVDTLVFAGKYQFLPQRPFIPGKGPAGIVSAIGDKVTGVKPGDRVLAMAEHGGYAELAVAHESNVYRLPDAMSFPEATTIGVALDTAWMALVERGRLAPGETVLVLGATGAVGNGAIQIAKAKGAKVIAAVSAAGKEKAVLDAGADHVIYLDRPNLADSFREQVYAVNGGKGADVVIDPLGGDIFDAAIRAVAWRGRLVVIGFAAGRIPTLKVNYVLLKNIEVSGMQISDYRKRLPDLTRQCFEEIFRYFSEGKIRIAPVTVYKLAEYQKALDDLTNRRATARAALRP